MRNVARCCFACWVVVTVGAPVAWAQDSAPVVAPAAAVAAPTNAGGTGAGPAVAVAGANGNAVVAPAAVVAAVPATAVPAPRERTMQTRFSREKPVLGLPLGSSTARAHCATDGTAFYDLASSGTSAGQALYGVSPEGGVKHVLRKLPIDYTEVLVRDFFAGDQQMVTLLEADKRDGGADAGPPRATDYFLSLEDQAGDSSDLVLLSVRFKPVKVARFGAGDVMMLGWDEGNELPVLAMVKEDGTIRRFIDFDDPRRPGTREDQIQAEEAAARERVTFKTLEGATFVAYGTEVLLTYPGTTKAVLAMGASGETRSIPIQIPPGYVLSDVLASSGGRATLVVRVKEADERTKPDPAEAAKPKMMLIEYDSVHGSRIGRIVFDKPAVADVTCAPNSSLVAIFPDAIPDVDHAASSNATPGAVVPMQLVVSTARR
jgi:hypothetical protein